jgi:hypothetical protein
VIKLPKEKLTKGVERAVRKSLSKWVNGPYVHATDDGGSTKLGEIMIEVDLTVFFALENPRTGQVEFYSTEIDWDGREEYWEPLTSQETPAELRRRYK